MVAPPPTRAQRSQPRRACLLLLLLLLLIPRATVASPVNAEVLRPAPLDPGVSGGVDASLAIARGNVDFLDVGAAARLQHQTLHPHEQTGLGRPPFIAQQPSGPARPSSTRRSSTPAGPACGTPASAPICSRRSRPTSSCARAPTRSGVPGSGSRPSIARLLVWFGSGYMVEYDRIIPAPGSGDPPEVVEHRWTNYASARLAVFDGRLLLQNTIYVQPRFDAPADLRILEELEALAKLTTVFGLGATFSVVHDSAPPSAIVPTDLRLSTSVRLSF